MSSFLELPARVSPKENSGANGKLLPKPLLFHGFFKVRRWDALRAAESIGKIYEKKYRVNYIMVNKMEQLINQNILPLFDVHPATFRRDRCQHSVYATAHIGSP